MLDRFLVYISLYGDQCDLASSLPDVNDLYQTSNTVNPGSLYLL